MREETDLFFQARAGVVLCQTHARRFKEGAFRVECSVPCRDRAAVSGVSYGVGNLGAIFSIRVT